MIWWIFSKFLIIGTRWHLFIGPFDRSDNHMVIYLTLEFFLLDKDVEFIILLIYLLFCILFIIQMMSFKMATKSHHLSLHVLAPFLRRSPAMCPPSGPMVQWLICCWVNGLKSHIFTKEILVFSGHYKQNPINYCEKKIYTKTSKRGKSTRNAVPIILLWSFSRVHDHL